MKLGVSYNIFDGEELLEGSIKQIRSSVDYISVVYQTISNFGDECNEGLVELLYNLKAKGLVDEVHEYLPNIKKGGHFNEITKRNIGLSLSQGAKCTHHMSMDSDEYYVTEEFDKLKALIIDGDYDATYCQMQTYYKSWEYCLNPPEDYYVSLIYKINNSSNYVMGAPSPVLVDPTRRMSPIKNPLILTREQIQMHHGSYIRDNIKKKLINSSASTNFKDDIEKIVKYYNNWKYPNPVLWGGVPVKKLNIKRITPLY
jgi:hypothetical protein